MTRPRLAVLGVFSAIGSDGAVAKLPTRKSEALAAILALSPALVPRERILGLLWGESSENQARHSLSQALTALRRVFGSTAVLADRESVGLESAAIDIDAREFLALAARDDAASLEQAVALLRGPLLQDFTLREAPFEDWLADERAQFLRFGTDAALRLGAIRGEHGDQDRAREAFARALALDPLSEAAHLAIMRLHLDHGRTTPALQQYAEAAAVLRRELDVAPGPELEAARQQARLRDAAPVGATGGERGERKYATALAVAAWPIGSSAAHDPEDLQARLDAVLVMVTAQVRAAGGQVVRTTQDQLVAAFGIPTTLEDHATRACRAAIAIQAASSEPAHLGIRVRIALDAGELVLRPEAVGGVALFGLALHRVSHLVALPDARPLVATTLVRDLTRGRIAFAVLPEIVVLAPGDPPETLLRPASPVQHGMAIGSTAFVGREAELDSLAAACAATTSGHGQLVAIMGEAGIGKSRLVKEFAATALPPGWRAITAGTDPQFIDAAYYPFRGLLRAFFALADTADATAIRARVETTLTQLSPTAQLLTAPLLSLLDCEPSDPGWEQLEPDRRRRRIMDAVIHLLHLQSQITPLLVVIEDLHWLDSASRELLEDLVASLTGARLLVLVNFRPEFSHGWAGRSYFRQLRIDPLRADATAILLGQLMGDDRTLETLKATLIERTGGNPFFLEECVRALSAAGTLAGGSGDHHLAAAADASALPATVHAVIGARVDRLPAADKHLLQVASVVGTEVPRTLLMAASGLDEPSFQGVMRRLHAEEFLLPVRMVPDQAYRFKHALTHEVVYGSLLRQDRRDLHSRVLAVLESGTVHGSADVAEALAHHAAQAEDWAKAARYAQAAGARSAARNAGQAAISHFEQALVALDHLPPTVETKIAAIDLHFALRDELFVTGWHDRIPAHLNTAAAIAEEIGDISRLCRARLILSGWHWYAGQCREALAAARVAGELAARQGDPLLPALALYRQGVSHGGLGDYQASANALRAAIAMLDRDGLSETVIFGGYPSIFCRNFLTWSLAELGETEEAVAVGRAGWDMAWARPNIYSRAVIAFGYGHALLRLGKWAEAREVLVAGLGLYGSSELPFTYPYIAAPLGYLLVAAGEMEAGFTYLRRANETEIRRMAPLYAHVEIWLAEAQRITGENDAAMATVHRALATARVQGEAGHEAWAQRCLGDLLVGTDPIAACAAYDAAAAIATPRGMRPLLAEITAGRERLGNAVALAPPVQS